MRTYNNAAYFKRPATSFSTHLGVKLLRSCEQKRIHKEPDLRMLPRYGHFKNLRLHSLAYNWIERLVIRGTTSKEEVSAPAGYTSLHVAALRLTYSTGKQRSNPNEESHRSEHRSNESKFDRELQALVWVAPKPQPNFPEPSPTDVELDRLLVLNAECIDRVIVQTNLILTDALAGVPHRISQHRTAVCQVGDNEWLAPEESSAIDSPRIHIAVVQTDNRMLQSTILRRKADNAFNFHIQLQLGSRLALPRGKQSRCNRVVLSYR